MGSLFSKTNEILTDSEKTNIIINHNLSELRVLYRDSRLLNFEKREKQSNKYLNSLVKIPWLRICKRYASESYIGIYFKNKLIGSDLDKFNTFIVSIFGENIKIRNCCNISLIWGTVEDELCEINFGHGCGKYAALKLIEIGAEEVEVDAIIV
jgi:hypothetical protein